MLHHNFTLTDKKTGKLNLEKLVGMRLEARDRKNPSLDACATIRNLFTTS
jgi:hypothetical protein